MCALYNTMACTTLACHSEKLGYHRILSISHLVRKHSQTRDVIDLPSFDIPRPPYVIVKQQIKPLLVMHVGKPYVLLDDSQ